MWKNVLVDSAGHILLLYRIYQTFSYQPPPIPDDNTVIYWLINNNGVCWIDS